MKIVRTVDKIIEVMCKLALLCGGLLLMAMAINVTYGVLARYLFNNPSVYAIELTKILMIPALVLAVPYVQRYNRHLQVDFLAARMPDKVRLVILEVITVIGALFVGFILVWKGWESVTYSFSIHETSYASWAEPLWPVRLTIPIGYGLLSIVLIRQLVVGIVQVVKPEKKQVERPEPVPTLTVESEQV